MYVDESNETICREGNTPRELKEPPVPSPKKHGKKSKRRKAEEKEMRRHLNDKENQENQENKAPLNEGGEQEQQSILDEVSEAFNKGVDQALQGADWVTKVAKQAFAPPPVDPRTEKKGELGEIPKES